MIKGTRRDFLRTTASFAASSLSLNLFCKSNSKTLKTPLQNLLFIVADDHVASVLGCYGNTIIQTPNLDAMAAGGVRFANAFANAPVCIKNNS